MGAHRALEARGWKFVVCGDFRGKLLPMFDRWGDVMKAKNIAKSRFMYDLVNGLSCQLSTAGHAVGLGRYGGRICTRVGTAGHLDLCVCVCFFGAVVCAFWVGCARPIAQ